MGVDYLGRIRKIVMDELDGHPGKVYLFSSRARGTARQTSDVDIAVLPEGPTPWAALSRIRERLEESTIPFQVDVVDLSETDEDFRSRVLKEGVLWNA